MNSSTLKKILGACCIAAGIYLLTSKKTEEPTETVTVNKGESLVKDLICLAVKNV